jgi:non-heme chloroperoxidase
MAVTEAMAIAEHGAEQVSRANADLRTPVVFVHGFWLLPSSWDRWATLFQEQGYVAVAPGWPDDPPTVTEAKAHPEVFAGKSIGADDRQPLAGGGGHGTRVRAPLHRLAGAVDRLVSRPIALGPAPTDNRPARGSPKPRSPSPHLSPLRQA